MSTLSTSVAHRMQVWHFQDNRVFINQILLQRRQLNIGVPWNESSQMVSKYTHPDFAFVQISWYFRIIPRLWTAFRKMPAQTLSQIEKAHFDHSWTQLMKETTFFSNSIMHPEKLKFTTSCQVIFTHNWTSTKDWSSANPQKFSPIPLNICFQRHVKNDHRLYNTSQLCFEFYTTNAKTGSRFHGDPTSRAVFRVLDFWVLKKKETCEIRTISLFVQIES